MLEEIKKALRVAKWKASSIDFFVFEIKSLLKDESKITNAEIDPHYASVIIDHSQSVEMRRA